jgi:hypothetical protein
MTLAVSLSAKQITGANRLHDRLSQWQAADRALRTLAERFPEFDAPATLLKVVAINALYGTNIYAVIRMARHVEQVMAEPDASSAGIELVERLAELPGNDTEGRTRWFLSFASKFAHFFLDAERFPIMDSYARKMVAYHLGRANCVCDSRHPYRAFVQNLQTLKQSAGLSCTNRQLDQYLWIAGQYRAWCEKPQTLLNKELTGLFADTTVTAKIKALLPSADGKST